MATFATRCVDNWSEFLAAIEPLGGEWLFRGHADHRWHLETRLERCLKSWGVPLRQSLEIEKQMVRDYRRGYEGADDTIVQTDFFYSLARIQHYGGPTRLLDVTYSPYVALQFAIGRCSTEATVWCVNAAWCSDMAAKMVGREMVKRRNDDKERNDSTFIEMYRDSQKRFAFAENALRLNARIRAQQALFLAVGDPSVPFEENLMQMDEWENPAHIMSIRLPSNRDAILDMTRRLLRMNVHSGIVFPGETGTCQALEERIPLFANFADRGVGGSDSEPWRDERDPD